MNNKLVFVYTIPRDSILGLHTNIDPNSGKRLNKNKIGTANNSISALPNQRTQKLSNYISTQPWLEDGIVKRDPTGRELTLQDKLEIEWKLPKGYLTDEKISNLDDIYSNKTPMTYFQKMQWVMEDGCTVFDLSKFNDLMGYYVCLGSKLVANSEKEWRQHKWPNAQYYIAIENEMDEIAYKSNQNKLEAFTMLNSEEMTPIIKRKIAVLLGLINVKAALGEVQINNLLYTYIDKVDSKQLSNIVKFKELYNMLLKPDTKIVFEAKYLLEKALAWRVVNEKQGVYTWIRSKGSIELGAKPEAAVEFLTDVKKRDLIDELEKEIRLKSNEAE